MSKLKDLKKKILRLETRIQKDTKKLSKLKWQNKKITVSPPIKKSGITPEGRARLAAAMKARWAARKQGAVAPNATAKY